MPVNLLDQYKAEEPVDKPVVAGPVNLLEKYGRTDLIEKAREPYVQEGNWEGWIKPTLKEVGEAATVGTVETIMGLGSAIGMWPVSKIRGVGELMRGKTAEEARATEEDIMSKAYQPKTESARGATGIVGKAFEVGLTPARMFGEGISELIGPKTGYLAELAAELSMFKAVPKVVKKGKARVAKESISRESFDKKMKALDPEQRAVVEGIHKETLEPKNLVKEREKKPDTEVESAYETQKDIWIGEKDLRVHDAKVEASILKDDLRSVGGEKKLPVKDAMGYDEAIQVYIDLKRDPSAVAKYYPELTKEQKQVVQTAKNLPEEVKAIADRIQDSYSEIGVEALDASVIKNMLDNYAARVWEIEPKAPTEVGRRFGTKTKHAKQRKFNTILEGWAAGYDTKVKGAVENLRVYKEEIVKTLEDKRFVDEMRKLKDAEGKPLLSTQKLDGYVEVEHPNMSVWEWSGKNADPAQTYGKNFFATEEGTLFENRKLYAPKDVAKNVNNILGVSKLQDLPGMKSITRLNEEIKAWVLQSSLFHYMAFMRSYYLPGFTKKGKGARGPRDAYKGGIESIKASDPVVRLGIRNGLTLGLKQDWLESSLREKTRIGKMVDQYKIPKATKDFLIKFREKQADFLFGEVGAGLKAKTFMLEFSEQTKKHPNTPEATIAKRVAALVNDDFGGLHLQRLGRNPTLQHIFRLVALAPDWTESNVRTMAKTLKNKSGDAAELKMYRDFWKGSVVKGLGISTILNYVLAGADIDKMIDNYKKAWRSSNMDWAKIDITPIYKAFGGEDENRRYFSLLGHFADPSKFIAHPIRSAKHKQSILSGMAFEGLTGTDWASRPFTTLEELITEGKTVTWGKSSGPIDYEQFPAYILSQALGSQPIQVQNLIGWIIGETDGFDAMARSMGLRVSRERKPKRSKKDRH